jgi:hypothetical protein
MNPNPQLPLCAQVGMLNGVVVGFLYGLLQFNNCCQAPPSSQLAWIALLLAGQAMIVSLFVLLVICRYTLGSVLFAVFVNAVIVAFAVVFVLNAIGASVASPIVGVIVGLVIGLIVGWMLCLLCDVRPFSARQGG